jgi:transposase
MIAENCGPSLKFRNLAGGIAVNPGFWRRTLPQGGTPAVFQVEEPHAPALPPETRWMKGLPHKQPQAIQPGIPDIAGSGTLLVTWPDGEDGPVPFTHHFIGMKQNLLTFPCSDIRLASVALVEGVWVVEAHKLSTGAACPRCGVVSSARHSSYQRRLWDLPIQGRPVRVTLSVRRWQCRNTDCGQSIFTERLPGIADARARRTQRTAGVLRLLGHVVGGRPGERLAGRLGFAGSRATILRHLVRHQSLPDHMTPRVVGIDEWASKKGLHFGTIAVDLERRTVIDVLPDRSAVSTARWLAARPSIELIARDRDGLYADASRQGAPQAKQIADRFHLIQNLRGAVERQLCGLERPIRGYRTSPGHRLFTDNVRPDGGADEGEALEPTHVSGRSFLLAAFAKVRIMYDAGETVAAITRKLHLTRRIVDKWVRLESLPERARMAPKSSTPAKFANYLRDRWKDGEKNGRRLLKEVREQGYTGCYSQLAAYVAPWREKAEKKSMPPSPVGTLPLDPRTGGVISPIIAAALCIKPRDVLTPRQAEKVDVLKQALPMFASMRSLAMRFRGLLRGHNVDALDDWISDAMGCGLHTLQRFAARLSYDISAVRNAICEPWSNGQTEGQINRLKMLKRTMYGRASAALLRARMRPLRDAEHHQM